MIRLRSKSDASDGYPVHWPDDPAAFLSPRGLLGAWVAARETSVLGHVALAAPREPVASCLLPAAGGRQSNLAFVARLFVHPDERRRGWAERLLEAAAGDAYRRGLLPVLDVVEHSRPAINLYERAGWSRVGSGPATWTMPDGRRPRLHYYVAPAWRRPAAEST